MKIIIDTEQHITTEEWSKTDKELPWGEVQKQKILALGLTLAGQMAVAYEDKTKRERVLASMFDSMVEIMDQVKIGD